MPNAAMETQAGNVRPRFDRKARPLEKDKLHQLRQFLDVLPEMKLRQLVAPNDPIELVQGKKRPEVAGRVDAVTDAAALQFVIGNLEAAVPFDGRPEHRQA